MRRWTTTWLIPATLAVLSVLERTVAQAPGDGDSICSAPNRAIGYPDYVRPLMDSWNYEVLLSPNVWNQVSLDSTKTPRGEWRAVGNCNGGTVAVCSVLPGEQNNWLFTQHINKSVTVNDSYPVRVFVNITSTFVYCDNCSPLIMVLKYFTNTQQQTDIYTNIKNYTPDGIMPRNTIKYFEATVTDHFYFDMDQDEDGLYFALQDYNMENRNRGACLTVSRMLVYRYECPARTVGVVRYPTIQAPISGNVPIGVECIENAHPLNDSMLVNCTSEGQWEVNSIACECDPGFFAETDDDITTCRANFKPVQLTKTVSEGQVFDVCFINIETQALIVNARTRDGTAVGNFDYRVLDENITFETDGTSQCVTIHIASDSLVEDKENFTVVLLNLNDSNKILSQTTVYISSNVVATNNSCVDGSVRLVSDVEQSSLQLVEMCSEGVWTPVCDYNWTVADAAVVCKESGYGKLGSYKVLESSGVSHHARTVPNCVGNETSLFDCKELLDSDVACNYVLAECTEEVAVHINNSCVDGSVRLVSDVEQSSFQLVEMCSEEVWSPVCDYNWTVADATVVCRELGMSTDNVVAEVLQETGHKEEMENIRCQGNEAKLANCFIEPGTLLCHSVLVQCNIVSDDKDLSNVTRSGGEPPAGAVVGAVIAVLVVGVGVTVLIVVIGVIWAKKKHLKSGNTSCHSLPPDTIYDYVDVSKGSNGQMSVSMKYNEAYSSVERKIITDPNQAYGVVQL